MDGGCCAGVSGFSWLLWWEIVKFGWGVGVAGVRGGWKVGCEVRTKDGDDEVG